MLFRQKFLDGIRDGAVTLAFRRWIRPSVKAGGTLRTGVGELHIGAIVEVTPNAISDADARRAGYPSRETLLAELDSRHDGPIFRIELGPLSPDSRIALRNSPATNGADYEDLVKRLRRLDARSPDGPWTHRVLELLRQNPGVRAADLCNAVGQEKIAFKINVRKLKNLGLTESLEIGYRISPRGQALLDSSRSTETAKE